MISMMKIRGKSCMSSIFAGILILVSILKQCDTSTAIIVVLFVGKSVLCLNSQVSWSPRQINTKLGVVQGFIRGEVEIIYNLPYASPPLETLRFMPPVSGSPWTGLRRSESPSPVCPQVLPDLRNETETLKIMPKGRLAYLKRLIPHLRNQNEDCLYLNVYSPLSVAEEKMEEKVPVLVFIHGDDWAYGSGNPYDPSGLVSYANIIVVTLNYRLGILGFLNANSDSHFRLPYNFAMLDQIAALQWVQENIAIFGGDRFNVTLMGHGKGAVLVNFLMVSSAVPTGLLFHRVILSSGSALSPVLSLSDSSSGSGGPELSKRFATRVRCPPEPSSTMLECLRQVPVRHFLESELWNLFGPSSDGILIKSEQPSEASLMNKGSHYPMLFGVVRMEILPSLSDHDATYGMENERRRELLRDHINKYYRFHRNEILAGALHEYTDWERPTQHPQSVRDETLDALGDVQVVAPMTKVGDLHSQSLRSRAYFYVFEYQSKSSDYQQKLGCVHGEEVPYIFGLPMMMNPDITETVTGMGLFTGNFTASEVQLSLTVMRFWANFIRFGNPNGDPKHLLSSHSSSFSSGNHGLGSGSVVRGGSVQTLDRSTSLQPLVVDWPLYESLDKKYLLLDLRSRVKSHYRAHQLSFWLHLVPDYQKNDEDTDIPSTHHGYIKNSTNTTQVVGEGSNFTNSQEPPKLSPRRIGNDNLSHNSNSNHNNVKEQQDASGLGGESPKRQHSVPVSPSVSVDDEGVGSPFSFFSGGFHTYSTALSVTIAIGISLFILNILIFATFYYEREKRLQAFKRRQELEETCSSQQMTSRQTESATGTWRRQSTTSLCYEDDLHETQSQRESGTELTRYGNCAVKRYSRRPINEVLSIEERTKIHNAPPFLRIQHEPSSSFNITRNSAHYTSFLHPEHEHEHDIGFEFDDGQGTSSGSVQCGER